MTKLSFLNGNSLKLLGALFMVIDHIGVFLFPDVSILRYIGRLAFPIFAFMISEGAKYTKNKTNYFLGICTLTLLCQYVVYFYDNKNLEMSSLVAFTLSIPIIYALQNLKRAIFEGDRHNKLSALWLFSTAILLSYLFTRFFVVDYGFYGILTPVFASIFDFRGISVPDKVKRLDRISLRVLSLGAALIMLGASMNTRQFFALFSLPLLLLYSEKRGKINMKYFFYVFYPLHILVLEGIALIIS